MPFHEKDFLELRALKERDAARPLQTAGDPAYVRSVATDSDPAIVDLPTYRKTPFGDIRVATPYTLADIVNKYNIDPLIWDTVGTGGGSVAHVPLESSIRLASDGTLGAKAGLRTDTFFRYQAGKAMRVITTVVHDDAGRTGQRREWGLFIDEDGVFWRLDGTTLSCVVRSSASGVVEENVITQIEWLDTYDDLDLTKGNIFEIAFQWLGVGEVQFFVNGRIVADVRHPNTLARVYMRTAVLPVCCEVNQDADGAAGSMRFICASVRSEGGDDPPEEQFGYALPAAVTVSTTLIPLFSIRVKDTFNSVDNRMHIYPRLLSIAGDQRALTRLILNPTTLTNATFAVDPDANSGVEVDIAATAVAGGRTLGAFYSTANSGALVDLAPIFKAQSPPLRKSGYGTSRDTLTVAMIRASNQDVDAVASLAWGEVR